MKNFAIAAAVLTLGLGALTLPASAEQDEYGQYRYTQNDPTRFSPNGLASQSGDEAGARDTSSNAFERRKLFDQIDAKHRAY